MGFGWEKFQSSVSKLFNVNDRDNVQHTLLMDSPPGRLDVSSIKQKTKHKPPNPHSLTPPKQSPHDLLPKLFGPLRERYASRPGGYTRVLRMEPLKPDQAPSAILELVDGPKDMRFAMTAKTLARQRADGVDSLNEYTAVNVKKVTRFRKGGESELEKMVEKISREERAKEKEEAKEAAKEERKR